MDDTLELVSDLPDPAGDLERRQVQERVRAAIDQLPEAQRRVTELYYLSEYSQREIASALDVPLPRVKKRLQYARERLKERFVPVTAIKKEKKAEYLVEVARSDEKDAYITMNFYPFLLHDESEFNGGVPNEHGILEDDPDIRTLVEHAEHFGNFWDDPETKMPFLVRVDGRPAGFVWIVTHPYVVADTDYAVQVFFLLHIYRRREIFTQVAHQFFALFHGRWDVYAYLEDKRSQDFWQRAISEYTKGNFEDFEGPTHFVALGGVGGTVRVGGHAHR